jgi:hypothetical protein
MLQKFLPPEHPTIQTVKNNLTKTLAALEQQKKDEEAE